MIRKSQQSDITQILDICLNASIKAHGFIKKEFWESKIPDMRDIYLPSTETYVYHIGGSITKILLLRAILLNSKYWQLWFSVVRISCFLAASRRGG